MSQAPAEAPKAVTDEMNVIAVASPKTPILLGRPHPGASRWRSW